MTNLIQDDTQIALFCEMGTGYEEFLYLAAQPLLFSTDLLYKLWLNFRAYKHKNPQKQASYIVVSDLILSGICEAIGADLFCIVEEKRKKLSVLLDPATRKKVAFFIEQYALQNKAKIGENIYNVHTLWAKSVYDAQEMERIVIEKLKTSNNDYQKVNYLSLYFKTLSTDSKGLEKTNISLEFTEDVDDPHVLKYVPKELEERVRNWELLGKTQEQENNKFQEIENIERFLNLNLKKVSSTEAIYYTPKSFQINVKGELIGLNLNSCGISDIGFLKNSVHLSHLILGKNHLTDITPLGNLSNLLTLNLESNSIKKIDCLSPLSKITYLDLSFNKLKAFPIALINNLDKLENLYLRGNQITNLPQSIYNSKENCLILIKEYNSITVQKQQESEAKSLLSQADAYQKQTEIYLALTKYQEALQLYRKLGKTNSVFSILAEIGNIYFSQNNYDKAFKYFKEENELVQQLIEVEPKNVTLINNLSNSYIKMGDIYFLQKNYTQALEFYQQCDTWSQKAIEIELSNMVSINNLSNSLLKIGEVYLTQKLYYEALLYFKQSCTWGEKVLEYEPFDITSTNCLSNSLLRIGEIYLSQKEYKKGIEYLEKCNQIVERICELEPNKIELIRILSKSYLETGDAYKGLKNYKKSLDYINESIRLIRKIHKINPKDTGYRKRLATSFSKLGLIHSELNNREKAIEYIDKSLQLNPDNLSLEKIKDEIVHDILKISEINTGKLKLVEQIFSLYVLLENFETLLQSRAEQKGLSFVIQSYKQLPEYLIGDRVRLYQILMNLLNNAIKFTEKGEIRLITTLLKKTEDTYHLRFEVSDTGIGIANKNLEKIFGTFNKVIDKEGYHYEGTGLGLSIVKQLVILIGGSIEVQSEVGVGSTFCVELSFKSASQAEIEAEKTKALMVKEFPKEWIGKKILILEDNKINQLFAKNLLKKYQFDLTLADNIAQARQKMSEVKFDCLLADVRLPDGEGIDFVAEIQHTEGHLNQATPVIILTVGNLEDKRKKAKGLSILAYMNKPLSPEILTPYLESLFQKKQPKNTPIEEEIAPHFAAVRGRMKGIKATKKEILFLALNQVKDTLPKLQIAVSEENWNRLYNEVHNIKSTIQLAGITSLESVILKLEESSYKRENVENIPELVATFKELVEIEVDKIEKILE